MFQPKIHEHFSARHVESGAVQPFTVGYNTLSRNEDVDTAETPMHPCLVEISASSTQHHFLRVYLAHRLAPILGDCLYGNRVQSILGKRLAIGPVQADNLATFQKISPEVLRQLNLTDSETVPNCLHLREFKLRNFFGKKKDLVLKADPPDHFQYVCQTFKLNYPKEETVPLSGEPVR